MRRGFCVAISIALLVTACADVHEQIRCGYVPVDVYCHHPTGSYEQCPISLLPYEDRTSLMCP